MMEDRLHHITKKIIIINKKRRLLADLSVPSKKEKLTDYIGKLANISGKVSFVRKNHECMISFIF